MNVVNKQHNYDKDALREEIQSFLDAEHKVPWTKDESACRLVHFIYHGGIWDEDFRSRVPDLKRKRVQRLNEAEILSYLTMIVCTDRTQEGCIDAHIQNGKLEMLLRRWLELNRR